jgi:hypothetical protein
MKLNMRSFHADDYLQSNCWQELFRPTEMFIAAGISTAHSYVPPSKSAEAFAFLLCPKFRRRQRIEDARCNLKQL